VLGSVYVERWLRQERRWSLINIDQFVRSTYQASSWSRVKSESIVLSFPTWLVISTAHFQRTLGLMTPTVCGIRKFMLSDDLAWDNWIWITRHVVLHFDLKHSPSTCINSYTCVSCLILQASVLIQTSRLLLWPLNLRNRRHCMRRSFKGLDFFLNSWLGLISISRDLLIPFSLLKKLRDYSQKQWSMNSGPACTKISLLCN
jgi:hypothetical protein